MKKEVKHYIREVGEVGTKMWRRGRLKDMLDKEINIRAKQWKRESG
jgi:hypothetical protein